MAGGHSDMGQSVLYRRKIYRLAQLRTKVSGFKHEVDHTVPLLHPLCAAAREWKSPRNSTGPKIAREQ